METFKAFVAGGAGGMSLVFVGHPLDTAKVRLQTAPDGMYRGMFDCMQKTVRAEGIGGLYKGMAAPLVGITPIFAIYFWGFEQGKNIAKAIGGPLVGPDGNCNTLGIMFGGGFSAIPGSVIMVPGDRVKVMLQVPGSTFNGPVEVVKHLWKEGGMAALYKGTGLTLARDGPGSVAYYAGYELLLNAAAEFQECERKDVSTAAVLTCGGLAGCANWIVAVPQDTIKSRYQSATPGQYPGGVTQVFTDIIKKDGVTGLYRGLSAAMIRAFPANAACFFGYETAMNAMNASFPKEE